MCLRIDAVKSTFFLSRNDDRLAMFSVHLSSYGEKHLSGARKFVSYVQHNSHFK